MDFKRSLLGLFGIVSAMLAFVVDVVAFLHIFGVDVIIAPTKRELLNATVVKLELPIEAETLTFLVLFYSAIAMVFVYNWLYDQTDYTWGFWQWLLPTPIFALVPVLFVVWLWVFNHIPSWLYIFMLPTAACAGFTWWQVIAWESEKSPLLVSLFFVAPAVMWFQSAYQNIFLAFLLAIGSEACGAAMGLAVLGGVFFLLSKVGILRD